MRGAVGLVMVVALSSSVAWAQAPAPASTTTVGFMHAIHATETLEATAAFYEEVFGLSSPIRPFDPAGPRVLTDSPEATLRVSMLRIPGQGFNFELTEFSDAPRGTVRQPSVADPGAPNMKFLVRDIAPIAAAVKRLGHGIITTSGAPVAVNGPGGPVRAMMFRDPDGYIVEAIQVTPPADAPEGNVVGAIMGETVSSLETLERFWVGTMGLSLEGSREWSSDPAMLDLMGLPSGASFRLLTSTIPGSNARIAFTEIRGVPREPFSLRVTDPGASGMAIRVAGIASLLDRMKADGIRVLSRDQALVEWSDTIRNVFIKDPDGLNLELVGDAGPSR